MRHPDDVPKHNPNADCPLCHKMIDLITPADGEHDRGPQTSDVIICKSCAQPLVVIGVTRQGVRLAGMTMAYWNELSNEIKAGIVFGILHLQAYKQQIARSN